MKKLIFSISIAILGLSLNAQERYFDERYISSQTFVNPVLVNAGAVGSSEYHQVLLNYRNKWATFPDSPKSFILSYNGPVGNRLGLGGMLVTDSNGALETTKGMGAVSYTIDSPTNKVGFGLSAEYITHALAGDALNNPLIDTDDPLVFERLDGASFFDISFGIYGVYEDKITYGLALPSLLSSRIEESSGEDDREVGYIFNLGYRYQPNGTDIIIEPSLFVKKLNNVPFHADINALLKLLDEKLYGGLSYTVGADEKIGFLIGARVNALNFFYTYNASRHEFQTYNNGSHEISLRFDIGRTSSMASKSAEAEDIMEQ